MTEKYEALRKAAEKAGRGTWTAQGGTVFFDDGDSALRTAKNPAVLFTAFENIGAWPDAIMEEDVAAFAAMANPSTILELLDELAFWKARCADLHETVGKAWAGSSISLTREQARKALKRHSDLVDKHSAREQKQ